MSPSAGRMAVPGRMALGSRLESFSRSKRPRSLLRGSLVCLVAGC